MNKKEKTLNLIAGGLAIVMIAWGLFHIFERPYIVSFWFGSIQVAFGGLIIYFRFLNNKKRRRRR